MSWERWSEFLVLNPTYLDSDDNCRSVEHSDKRLMIYFRVKIMLARE